MIGYHILLSPAINMYNTYISPRGYCTVPLSPSISLTINVTVTNYLIQSSLNTTPHTTRID